MCCRGHGTNVPEVIRTTDKAQVRVSLVSNPNIFDVSDEFTIRKPVVYIDITIDQTGVDNCITAIENTFPDNNIAIFPNPNRGIFTISMKNARYNGDIKIMIFDETGSTVYTDLFDSVDKEFDKTVDLSDYKGVFIVTLIGPGYKYSGKLVIN